MFVEIIGREGASGCSGIVYICNFVVVFIGEETNFSLFCSTIFISFLLSLIYYSGITS